MFRAGDAPAVVDSCEDAAWDSDLADDEDTTVEKVVPGCDDNDADAAVGAVKREHPVPNPKNSMRITDKPPRPTTAPPHRILPSPGVRYLTPN